MLNQAGRGPQTRSRRSDTYGLLRAQIEGYAETTRPMKAVEADQQLLHKLMAWNPTLRTISAMRPASRVLERRSPTLSAASDEPTRPCGLRHREQNSGITEKLRNAQFLLRQSLAMSPLAQLSAPQPRIRTAWAPEPSHSRTGPSTLPGTWSRNKSLALLSSFVRRFRFPEQRGTLVGASPGKKQRALLPVHSLLPGVHNALSRRRMYEKTSDCGCIRVEPVGVRRSRTAADSYL